MVAATSPQLTWRHEFKDKNGEPTGEVKYPNLDLAMHAASLARKYPDEPAPKLVDRLVEESQRRTPEERKLGPSELGGLGESVLKAIRIYRGEDPERVLGAPKTRSFYNNLDRPDEATTVTMDEHMGRAVLGKSTEEGYSKSTEGVFDEKKDGSGYTWAANIVTRLAKEKSVLTAPGAGDHLGRPEGCSPTMMEADQKAKAKRKKSGTMGGMISETWPMAVPLRKRDGSIRAYALVSADDYDAVTRYRWSGHVQSNGRIRPVRRIGKRIVPLARELLGLEYDRSTSCGSQERRPTRQPPVEPARSHEAPEHAEPTRSDKPLIVRGPRGQLGPPTQ